MHASMIADVAPCRIGPVDLRLPAPGDFPVLAEIRRDRDLQALLLAVIDATDDVAVRQWIARRTADANGVFLVVTDADSDAAIGYVQIADIHRRNRCGYVGIALRRSAQGRGFGKAALQRLHAFAKEDVGLEKLLLTVRSDNALALNMYLSAGYRTVGTLERHFRDREDRLHDVALLECRLSEGME